MHLKLFTLLPSVLFTLLAMLTLAACSSMEPDSTSERFGNQVPADFKWQTFDTLNPEIRLAQVADNFKVENEARLEYLRTTEEGINLCYNSFTGVVQIPCLRNHFEKPYQEASIVWGKNKGNESCSSTEPNPCCSAADNANPDSIGISIEIMQTYLKWDAEMLCAMKTASTGTNPTAADFKEGYVYRFLLYGRQGEEIRVIDSLTALTDSAIFYKNYILYGRETGLAYRVCKDSEIKQEKSRDALVLRDYEYVGGGSLKDTCKPAENSKVTCNSSCVCNYSAYEFCAKEDSPHKLYVVAEKN